MEQLHDLIQYFVYFCLNLISPNLFVNLTNKLKIYIYNTRRDNRSVGEGKAFSV